jgi:splicing factor 1
MERESNTKIAIRGKGSVKEGSKGRHAGAIKGMADDENDELHVLIQGENDEDVSDTITTHAESTL